VRWLCPSAAFAAESSGPKIDAKSRAIQAVTGVSGNLKSVGSDSSEQPHDSLVGRLQEALPRSEGRD